MTEHIQWCYSTNEERFHGYYDTEAEAHVEAQAELECDGTPGDEYAYWVARVAKAEEFLDERRIGEWAQEHVEEQLADEIGWDDRIVELPIEAQEELGQMIIKFLREKGAFKAYGVKSVKEHRHTIPQEQA